MGNKVAVQLIESKERVDLDSIVDTISELKLGCVNADAELDKSIFWNTNHHFGSYIIHNEHSIIRWHQKQFQFDSNPNCNTN